MAKSENAEPGVLQNNAIASDNNDPVCEVTAIRIALCDDDETELSAIKRIIESFCAKRPDYAFEYFTFKDPLVLLDHIRTNGGFDILLLDIYMPGKKGTQVAETLRRRNDQCEIIFITSSDDHAMEAYKVNAIHYIRKPVREKELCYAVNRALVQLGKKPSASILIKTTAGMYRINATEIVSTKARAHYQQISLSDGTIYDVRMTVGELYEMIRSAEKFMRIGAAHIVSVRYILSIDAKKITMKNGTSVPLLRNTYKKVRQEYLFLLFGGKEGS